MSYRCSCGEEFNYHMERTSHMATCPSIPKPSSQDDVQAVLDLMPHINILDPNRMAALSRILDQRDRYEKVLNQIAILGCSEHAYTKEFTEKVNQLVREVLEEK